MSERRGDYDAYRERQAEDSRERSRQGRDVGPLPAVADKGKREACRASLRLFAETYFADQFRLAWSDDHLTVIAKIESCVLGGGRFALAMPRGSGKTTLCEVACVWALSYGHRRFVFLIAATKDKAVEILDRVKGAFEHNEALAADFPEVCYPIHRLERIYNRANGQTLDGRPTRIGWTKQQVVLPDVAGSKAGGGIIRVSGITGSIRGAKHVTPDGAAVRPDLVVADDPSTESSAHSPTQNDRREQILKRAVLGLAGPGKEIAVVCPCTTIVRNDLADRLLNRKVNPGWQGVRLRAMYAMPEDEKLWDEYSRIRAESFSADDEGRASTEFYRANREAMDRGAAPAWPARYGPTELSAVQACMNLYLDDPSGFAAEYQNEPRDEKAVAVADEVTPEALAEKVYAGVARGTVPAGCSRLTCFVDVQGELLFWLVAAWDEAFGGCVVDYGTLPGQARSWFTAADARQTLTREFPAIPDRGARIYAGLEAVGRGVLNRDWKRADGLALRVSRCLVDANWGPSRASVYQWCQRSAWAAVALPSHGKGLKAGGRPMGEWTTPCERKGDGWRLMSTGGGRHLILDTNALKTFVAARLKTPFGTAGSVGVFGPAAPQHRLLFDHWTAEVAVEASVDGRTVSEWRAKPGRRENHWWDCLVGAAAAAGLDGLVWSPAAAAGATVAAAPGPIRLSEVAKAKRGSVPLNRR